jgi:hypothetical protein
MLAFGGATRGHLDPRREGFRSQESGRTSMGILRGQVQHGSDRRDVELAALDPFEPQREAQAFAAFAKTATDPYTAWLERRQREDERERNGEAVRWVHRGPLIGG